MPRPINFDESNCTYKAPDGKSTITIKDLKVYKDSKQIISCWKFSLWDKIKLLFTGKLYLGVLGYSQPPVWIHVDNPFVDKESDNAK